MKNPNSKKDISLSKDSILVLMQEVYNELIEQRNTALKIQNKMISMMREAEDLITIGPVLEKQQKIINECAEKKLTITKILSNLWQKTSTNQENFSFSDLDEEALENLLNKDLTSDLGKYKTKN
jgi:hypothetical protein